MTNCNIIRDLLPLYTENLLSEESRQLIEEHIAACEECRTILYRIQTGVTTATPPDHKEFQTVLRSHKKKNNRKTLFLTMSAIVLGLALCLGYLWYRGVFHIAERQTSPNGATTTTVYNCDFSRYGRFPKSGGFTLIDKGYFNGSTTFPDARFQGLWWSVNGNYQVVSMYTDEGLWLSLADYTRNIGVNLDGRLNLVLYNNEFFRDVIYNKETGQREIEFQFIQWSLKDEPNMLIYFNYTDIQNQFHEGYFWYNYETGTSSGEMELS